MSFPQEVYRKVNYYILTVDFTLQNPYGVAIRGDFLDLIETDQDPTQILVRLNHGEAIRLSDAIPTVSPFSYIELFNKAGNVGILKLLVGHELFRSQRQNISIIADKVGLAKDANLTGIKSPNFINVNVGTTPTPIVTSPTLINMLLIQNNSASDVYLGSSTLQNIKISANGGSISITMPMNFKIDLSQLFVVSSATVTIAVMYA